MSRILYVISEEDLETAYDFGDDCGDYDCEDPGHGEGAWIELSAETQAWYIDKATRAVERAAESFHWEDALWSVCRTAPEREGE